MRLLRGTHIHQICTRYTSYYRRHRAPCVCKFLYSHVFPRNQFLQVIFSGDVYLTCRKPDARVSQSFVSWPVRQSYVIYGHEKSRVLGLIAAGSRIPTRSAWRGMRVGTSWDVGRWWMSHVYGCVDWKEKKAQQAHVEAPKLSEAELRLLAACPSRDRQASLLRPHTSWVGVVFGNHWAEAPQGRSVQPR